VHDAVEVPQIGLLNGVCEIVNKYVPHACVVVSAAVVSNGTVTTMRCCPAAPVNEFAFGQTVELKVALKFPRHGSATFTFGLMKTIEFGIWPTPVELSVDRSARTVPAGQVTSIQSRSRDVYVVDPVGI
jgi:hypothetical protein